MRSAKVVLTTDLMTNEGFFGKSIHEAVNSYVISPDLKEYTEGIECSYTSELVREGVVRVKYTSHLKNLQKTISIVHRYSFPLLHESREIGYIVSPENPQATSEILIALGDYKKNYFNIAVHDSSNYMMSCDVLVYNQKGEIGHYYMPESDFVSPLPIKQASIVETRDKEGRRVFRTMVELGDITEPQDILVGYNASGITTTETHQVTPENPVVISDVPLEDNPNLIPGDWLIGMTDEKNRLLLNAVARVEAEVATCTA
ncbi:DUF5944 family protein [Brevibacillus migulae]|uniref:DUF5944 family protein n=1 Tax=Brevibacillus migulae TaxID=1644114 RepID=UPI00106EA77D|nr:DUF5944 family protein [Brevibacillus migulae]